ncbi:MAG: hypothetical protein ACRC7N_14635 [Clostridium sp.]
MASSEKHIKQYKDNVRVFNNKFFKDENNFNWKVTIIFYAVVHLIESKVPKDVECNNHSTRYKFINTFITDIVEPYDILYKLSRKARYKCIKIKDRDVKNALVSLKKIEDSISV